MFLSAREVLFTAVCGVLLVCAASEGRAQGKPYPPQIACWTEAEKAAQRQAAQKLWVDLNAAIGGGAKRFVVPPGDYRFTGEAAREFALKDLSDFTLEATGATFWFERHGVSLERCRNVTVRGLSLDNDPLPFMQGIVTAVDHAGKTLDVALDPAYPMLPPERLANPGRSLSLRYYDPTGRDVVNLQWDAARSLERIEGNSYRMRLLQNRLFQAADSPDMVRPGYRIVFMLPGAFGVRLINSAAVTLEDVTIYACAAFAFFEKLGDGGHTYRRCRLIRRPGTDRLLANGRDGLHSYLVRKGPRIEGCEFSYAGDDLIAIHGFHSVVLEQRSPTQLVLVTPFERDFERGSLLRFYAHETTRAFGAAQVTALRPLAEPALKDIRKSLPQRIRDGGIPVRDFTAESETVLVDLDRPVSVPALTLAECTDRCGAGTVVRDSYLHDSFSRGIFVRAPEVLIEGNRVERISCTGILLQPESYWLESSFARGARILNNTVVDCAQVSYNQHYFEPFLGAIQVGAWFGKRLFTPPTFHSYTHNERVEIRGNRVIRPASIGILAMNLRDSVIAENVIEAPLTRRVGLATLNLARTLGEGPAPTPEALERARQPYYGVFLMAAENVRASDNRVVDAPPDLKGAVGIGPWTTGIEETGSRLAPGTRRD